MFRSSSKKAYWIVTSILGALPPLIVIALGFFLVVSGVEALTQLSLSNLATTLWSPMQGHFGIVLLLLGTLVSTALAMLFALIIGLKTAVYLALFSGPKYRIFSDAMIGLLGSVPSVVIGLWGITWLIPIWGNSLASATIVLAMMITPTFTLLAGAALRQVPADLVETARSLGASQNIVAWVAIRHARWGIISAATLAACRGLGEAAALSMVAGNVVSWPHLDGPIATLTTTLIIEFDGAVGLHRSALFLLGLLVMALIVGVSILGRHRVHHEST